MKNSLAQIVSDLENGNLKDAKKAAENRPLEKLAKAFRSAGYNGIKAGLAAQFLKGKIDWQAYCDGMSADWTPADQISEERETQAKTWGDSSSGLKPLTKVNPLLAPIAHQTLVAILANNEKEGKDVAVLNGLFFIACVDGIYHASFASSPVEPYQNTWTDADFGFGHKAVQIAERDALRSAAQGVLDCVDRPGGSVRSITGKSVCALRAAVNATRQDAAEREAAFRELLDGARYASNHFGKVPAFGNDIGLNVSKAQLLTAIHTLNAAIARVEGCK